MNGIKSIFSSKTFWGGVIGLIASSAPLALKWWTTSDSVTFTSVATELVTAISGAIGFAATVYGRWRASKSVSLLGGSK